MFRTTSILRSFSHTVEPFIQSNALLRSQQFQSLKSTSEKRYSGSYTQAGSASFQAKNQHLLMKPLINNRNIKISNIGIGTYKGSLNEEDDLLQFNGIVDSVMLGTNVIDTCMNFRGGRSEKTIRSALKYLIEMKNYSRNEFFIMSKAGYVREQLPEDIKKEVINDHCVHPAYLEQSLVKSLETMEVETLDVFYLNNFAECQLNQLGKDKFEQRLCRAFQALERFKSEKRIQYYGLASWNSFRVDHKHPNYLSLANIVNLAKKVGGSNHSFKFLQIPINILMPEAFAEKNQEAGSLLQTAQNLKINVISCSPLLNGTLINTPLPSDKLNCRNNGAKHLQIVRSIPVESLVSTLIGQKKIRNVKKNLQVLEAEKLNEEEWFNFFVPREEPSEIPNQ